MARRKSYNPEKRAWRGRSYKKGGERPRVLLDVETQKFDAMAIIDAFDDVFKALFPKKEEPRTILVGDKGSVFGVGALRQRLDEQLIDDVFILADLWKRQRLDPRVTGKMDPDLLRLLDKIEKRTLGDDRRCQCLAFKESKGSYHDIQCPARKP